MDGQAFLGAIVRARRRALELFVVAVVVALGVNLVAVWLAARIGDSPAAVVGAALVAGPVAFVWLRALAPRAQQRQVEGFVLYDLEAKRLVSHPYRYVLAHELEDYVRSAFTENPALESSWEREPLTDDEGVIAEGPAEPRTALGLLQQAAECFVLSHLSTYLTDYFPQSDDGDRGLATLSHTDIPNVLLQNRFLKLFSEPIEDRAAFMGFPDDLDPASLVSAHTDTGARYERFELTLPARSEVRREANGRVAITTRRFVLGLQAEVPGSNALLPVGYQQLYLRQGARDWDIHPVKIRFSVSLSPRPFGLMDPRRWHHYHWIDKWVEAFERDVAIDAYFERIGYESAYTAYVLSGAEE